MILLFNDYENLDDEITSKLEKLLMPERKIKYNKIKLQKDKYNSLIANALLLYGLKEQGYKKSLKIKTNTNGKPELKHSKYCFNFSHTDNGVTCIIDKHKVGIDIESIKDYKDNLMKRVLSSSEYNIIKNAKNKNTLFTMMWTKKESIVKLKGVKYADYNKIDTSNILTTTLNFEKFIISYSTNINHNIIHTKK